MVEDTTGIITILSGVILEQEFFWYMQLNNTLAGARSLRNGFTVAESSHLLELILPAALSSGGASSTLCLSDRRPNVLFVFGSSKTREVQLGAAIGALATVSRDEMPPTYLADHFSPPHFRPMTPGLDSITVVSAESL